MNKQTNSSSVCVCAFWDCFDSIYYIQWSDIQTMCLFCLSSFWREAQRLEKGFKVQTNCSVTSTVWMTTQTRVFSFGFWLALIIFTLKVFVLVSAHANTSFNYTLLILAARTHQPHWSFSLSFFWFGSFRRYIAPALVCAMPS